MPIRISSLGRLMTLPAPSRGIIMLVGALAYGVTAIAVQLHSQLAPTQMGAPIGYFSTALAALLCAMTVVVMRRFALRGSLHFACILMTVAFTIQTLDDAFSIHERLDNDDYLAFGLWIVAGGALLLWARLEKLPRPAQVLICAGFALHGVAALADGSDGGIFTFRDLSLYELGWSQEVLELIYLSCYIAGLGIVVLDGRARQLARIAQALVPFGVARKAVVDAEILELETQYWLSETGMDEADTDDERQQYLDTQRSVVERLIALPAYSLAGIAAKLRVLSDMLELSQISEVPEDPVELRLVEALVKEANALLDPPGVKYTFSAPR